MNYLPNVELLNLKDKVAIVTGGAMGIGLGIVQRLCEAGAKVVIADMDEVAAEESAKKMAEAGHQAVAIKTDVSDETSVKGMVAGTVQQYGSVDILVNNAGIYPNEPMAEMSSVDFDKVIAVNLRGVFLCTKAVSDKMIEQNKGGKIINITSIDALHPSGIGLSHYDASKHGVWGFTKNIALELASHQIWVNAVAPGGVATPGVKKSQEKIGLPAGVDPEAAVKAFLSGIPMKRMGEPDDIGKVVLFLASDMSSYMTGTQIVVDGGFLLS